jgi:hypothetical protein
MISRCENPNNSYYHNYGGRGVKVCPQWRESFEAFYLDKGPRPSPRHSIDRYPDMDGDYISANTRWATPEQQNRNTRRNVFVTVNDQTICLKDGAALCGLSYDRVKYLYSCGWSLPEAIGIAARAAWEKSRGATGQTAGRLVRQWGEQVFRAP